MTYRSVLGNREFLAILLSQALSTAGDQLARVAVAVLVFDRTGSGFAASATYAVSYLTYLVAGPVLSTLSDRYPRLTVMVVCDLLRAPLVLLLCRSDLPLWVVFSVLGLLGLIAPPFDSARSAVQPEILRGDDYVAGNAVMNIVMQVGQVAGFVAGGALVAALSVQRTLALDAATFLVSAGLLLAFLSHRVAAQLREDRHSYASDTADGFRFVQRSPDLRRYLLFSIIGSTALITPEGLAVPAAHDLGSGAFAAGVLTATIPAGFVVSGLLVLRVDAARRLELLFPLSLLAILPLTASPLAHSVPLLALLWTLAGLGAAINLIASAAYIQSCPSEFRSRAYGVAATLLFASQGFSLLVSGALSDHVGPRTSVALVSGASLVVLMVSRGLREDVAQGNRDLDRSGQG